MEMRGSFKIIHVSLKNNEKYMREREQEQDLFQYIFNQLYNEGVRVILAEHLPKTLLMRIKSFQEGIFSTIFTIFSKIRVGNPTSSSLRSSMHLNVSIKNMNGLEGEEI